MEVRCKMSKICVRTVETIYAKGQNPRCAVLQIGVQVTSQKI